MRKYGLSRAGGMSSQLVRPNLTMRTMQLNAWVANNLYYNVKKSHSTLLAFCKNGILLLPWEKTGPAKTRAARPIPLALLSAHKFSYFLDFEVPYLCAYTDNEIVWNNVKGCICAHKLYFLTTGHIHYSNFQPICTIAHMHWCTYVGNLDNNLLHYSITYEANMYFLQCWHQQSSAKKAYIGLHS